MPKTELSSFTHFNFSAPKARLWSTALDLPEGLAGNTEIRICVLIPGIPVRCQD